MDGFHLRTKDSEEMSLSRLFLQAKRHSVLILQLIENNIVSIGCGSFHVMICNNSNFDLF